MLNFFKESDLVLEKEKLNKIDNNKIDNINLSNLYYEILSELNEIFNDLEIDPKTIITDNKIIYLVEEIDDLDNILSLALQRIGLFLKEINKQYKQTIISGYWIISKEITFDFYGKHGIEKTIKIKLTRKPFKTIQTIKEKLRDLFRK